MSNRLIDRRPGTCDTHQATKGIVVVAETIILRQVADIIVGEYLAALAADGLLG